MSLDRILKEMKEIKPFTEDLLDGPPETLRGRAGRKNQSLERMTQLKREYRQDLLRNSVFVIVTGSLRNEFETLATGEKYQVFNADPEQFYNDLASRVAPVLYQGKSTVSDLFDVMGRHLEDKANELDILAYPQLVFKEAYTSTLENQEDFTKLVKRAINDQMGAEIVGVQAVSSILDKAIEVGHDKKTTSIILNTGDQTLVLELLRDLGRLTPKVFLVVAGKSTKILKNQEDAILVSEVNDESMEKTLANIKNLIKL